MEYAGLVLGAVPLAAQLFQYTLVLYSHHSESQDIGAISNKYRIFLQIERHRYENVGRYLGLGLGTSLPSRVQPATLELIIDILARIAQALLETEKLEKKYHFHRTSTATLPISLSAPPLGTPSPVSNTERLDTAVNRRLAQHALLAQQIKQSASSISSLKFVMWDKRKFEHFIADLRDLNDGLETLTGFQPQLQSQLIVQMLNVRAAETLNALGSATEAVYPTLSEIANRKAAYLRMVEHQQQQNTTGVRCSKPDPGLKLNYNDITLRQGFDPSGLTFGSYKGLPVVIEWKLLGDEISREQHSSRLEDMCRFLSRSGRVQDDLLSPSHLLGCIGYSLKPGQTERVAIIYETTEARHDTLQNMINDKELADFNLGARLRLALSLAECVFYLHLTGWLHKAIRSSNIIIRGGKSNGESGTKALHPYLAGFSTARQDGVLEISEKVELDAHSDLYQHPSYQSANKDENRYTRSYDIYSLGIVLLELGTWQLIETSGNYRPRGYNPHRFLNRLMKGPVQSLSFTMGNPYKRAVVWCLQGQFEGKENKTDCDSLTDSEKSTVFWEKVVLELVRSSVEE